MKVTDIKKFRNNIAIKLNEGRLHDAFRDMRSFSEGAMTFEITTDIDRLENNYRAMLGYLAGGASDPGRKDVYNSIVAEARSIADTMARRAMLPEGETLYFGTARTIAARPGQTPRAAVDELRTELRRLDTDLESLGDSRRSLRAEQLAVELFNRLWTTHPLSADDLGATREFITDSSLPLPPRAIATTALAAGALEFYDSRRAEALLNIYMDTTATDDVIALRALTGFFLIMFRYRRRPLPRALADTLAAARDTATWPGDLRTAAIEFMRTRDTARITEQLSKDIIPTLSKLAPEMTERLGDGELDIESMAEGENPAWDDMLKKDGLGDKLREISELQADGGDVYMSSFGALKHFPFFREIANWFLPFTTSHSEVASADNAGGSLSATLRRLPFLCDNDKFSVMMAMAIAPAAQREAATRAMESQQGAMHDMLSEIEKADSKTRRKNIINNYLRDLYRFYNLFRRKGEFFNPFARGIDLMAIDALSEGYNDVETLTVIAEFNIKHKFREEAAALFKKIDLLTEPDASRAQKIGFCLEKLGRHAEAISFYEEAEMLGGDSAWLLEHMARTYRRLGQPRKAIDTFKKLEAVAPENFSATIAMGNAFLEARRPAEAEARFHKALYLSPDSDNARRGLAWSQFLQRKFDAAAENYNKLLASAPGPEDYLNAGHTARGAGNMREAINYYVLSMESGGKDIDALEADLMTDSPWLAEAGINTDDDKLIIEAILYMKK